MLLTVVTFGIYSFWVPARMLKFHTIVDVLSLLIYFQFATHLLGL